MSQTLELFSIFDEKSESFSPPFTARTRGEAVRFFSATVNDPKSSISQYPADYILVHVGSMDMSTGKIIPINLENPSCMLFKGSDMVNPDK